MSSSRPGRPRGRTLLLCLAIVLASLAAWWLAVRPGRDGRTDRAARQGTDAHTTPPLREIDPVLAGRKGDGAKPRDASPSLAHEIGGTWRAEGTVYDLDGSPIADAHVRAVLERGELAEVLGTATTDAVGRFSIELRTLVSRPLAVRLTSTVEVEASASGFRPSPEDSVSFESGELAYPRILGAHLILVRGHVLTGRAVDRLGRPVANARVEIFGVPTRRTFLATTDREGRYVARLPAPGQPCRLEAQKPGVGAGRSYGGSLLFTPFWVTGSSHGAAGTRSSAPRCLLRKE